MIGISEEKFKKEVNIYFNNINEGFLKYKSKTLEETYKFQGDFVDFILECLKLNGEEHSYVDFYYYSLDAKERDKLRNFLERD